MSYDQSSSFVYCRELVGGNEETLGVYLVDTNGTEEVCANMDLIRLNHAVLDVPDVWNINGKTLRMLMIL